MKEQKLKCKEKLEDGSDCPNFVTYVPKKLPGNYMLDDKQISMKKKEVYITCSCPLQSTHKYEVYDYDFDNNQLNSENNLLA